MTEKRKPDPMTPNPTDQDVARVLYGVAIGLLLAQPGFWVFGAASLIGFWIDSRRAL